MMKRNHYDHEFKVQAVKWTLETGQAKACTELNHPENDEHDAGQYAEPCSKCQRTFNELTFKENK